MELAIIKNVKYGVDDRGQVSLRFDTMQDGSGALQLLDPDKATNVIKTAGVADVHELEGKACLVEVGRGTMSFHRLARD